MTQRPGKLSSNVPPRLILLDWMVPTTGGLEVVHRVPALPTEQPPYIIMLTIKDEKIDITHGICPECMKKLCPKYTPTDTTI